MDALFSEADPVHLRLGGTKRKERTHSKKNQKKFQKKIFLCIIPSMKNILLSSVGFFAFALGLGTAHDASAQVLVDAGHSASAPGSLSYSGFPEYRATARIQQKVVNELQRMNIPAVAISQSLSLEGRAQQKGTLLVSLHYDSIPQSMRDAGVGESIFGYSVFVSKKNPHYGTSFSCARSIAWGMRYLGEKPALFHQKGLGGKNARPLLDTQLGVHRFDDLIVLRKAQNPAVLVEMGMWINSRDEGRLMSESTLNNQARGIALGIAQCLGR